MSLHHVSKKVIHDPFIVQEEEHTREYWEMIFPREGSFILPRKFHERSKNILKGPFGTKNLGE